MRINHNIAALNTHRQLNSASTAQSASMEKLSSGLRINKAGDDAAGLAISEKMRGQIRGLDMASKNSQDAISLVQTAEGALNETHDILQRMRELAVQAGNDTNTTADREEIQKEINQMTSEINRIGNTTEFNTQKLLNGSKDVATTAKDAVEAKDAVAGEYTISFGDISTTADAEITIAGEKFTVKAATPDTDAGEFTSVADLVTALKANTNITDKYDVTEATGTVKFTQKAGTESATKLTGTGVGTIVEAKAGSEAVEAKEAVEAGQSLQFQIGANQNQSLTLNISDMRAVKLGISTVGTANDKLAVTDGTSSTTTEQALSVLTHDDAAKTVTTIQSAIDKVSAERSKLGANQNRLEHTINNLSTSSENLTAAESRIRDVDMAKEMMNQTKNSILSQAAQAMLAQANQQPQGVLQLLR